MENNVIVTAHPDDEVLWASSLPIRYKEAKWTIICCSVPRHDSIRAWKFFDACEVLGVTPRLIPSVESSPDQFLTHLDVIDLSPTPPSPVIIKKALKNYKMFQKIKQKYPVHQFLPLQYTDYFHLNQNPLV